jgi:hypothetical protein
MSDFSYELVLLDIRDGVGGMAVFTVGEFFRTFSYSRAVDAGYEILINSFMAGGTGGRNVFVVDGRPFVFMIENIVCAVAVGANSTREKSFSYQSLTVDAVGIVDFDIALRGLFESPLLQFGMAVAAQLGDFGAVGPVQLIEMGED